MQEFILNFSYVAFIIICFTLIITVLLQPGKSGGLGAAFGGGGSTVFGASGGTSTFRKITTGAAILFMLLSLLLAFLSVGEDLDTPKAEQARGLDFSAVAPVNANEIPGNQ